MALRRDCNYHVDFESHDFVSNGVILTSSVPTSPSEISLRNPGLINIDNVLLLAINLEHLLCIEAAKHFISFGVSNEGHSLYLAITKTEMFLHGADNRFVRHIHASLLFNLKPDLFRAPDPLAVVNSGRD